MPAILSRQTPEPVPVIFVATPTFGRVSMQWHLQMLDFWQLGKPMQRALYPLTVIGKAVDEARNEIVRHALAWTGQHGAKMSHIFFVDDDVFVQRETLIRLLSNDRPICSALYYAKTETPQPLLFLERGAGPATEIPEDDLVGCYAHGMGCTLIAREVFEAVEAPWFKTSEGHWQGDEWQTHTEDVYFLEKAEAAGYTPCVDTGHVVLHYDEKTGRAFPLDLWEKWVAA